MVIGYKIHRADGTVEEYDLNDDTAREELAGLPKKYVAVPTTVTEGTGTESDPVAMADNTEYILTDVSDLYIVFGEGTSWGTVTFGETIGTVSVTGYVSTDGDDIAEAVAGETWEFNCYKGRLLWKNWG